MGVLEDFVVAFVFGDELFWGIGDVGFFVEPVAEFCVEVLQLLKLGDGVLLGVDFQ